MSDLNYFPPKPAPPASAIEQTVTAGVTNAVIRTAADPTVPGVERQAAPAIIEAVLNQILPAILHSTSQEPWYQSRVFWSAIVSSGGLLAAGYGFAVNDTTQALIVTALTQGVSIGLALWGRYAKKPIG